MIKKIFISFGVLFCFFLMFLFGFDKINVLAYSDIGSALGSYPVKLDIDNYNTTNLYDYDFECGNVSSNASCVVSSDSVNVDVDVLINDGRNIYSTISPNISDLLSSLEKNTNYTLSYSLVDDNDIFRFIGIIDQSFNFLYRSDENTNLIIPGDFNSNRLWRIVVYLKNGSLVNQNINISEIMLYKGDYNPNLYYGKPFKFGYNVNYSLSINNSSSSQVNAGIAIINENGDYLKTGSCVIPANSSAICNNLSDVLYLPFNIDNNGYISFNYSLGLSLGPVGSLSVNSNDSGFNFVPVFNAYYKGVSTNNLYFKDRYIFNNLFLSGFNVSVNSSSLSSVVFGSNEVDTSFSINSNNVINFATDKKNETGIYNFIDYVSYVDSNPNDIYSFVITTGVSAPSSFENRFYTISFSNLSLRVSGDVGSSSPLPNNPDTIDKYNECSSWYDIPCQLGNGLTYVIYEAPIISPVLTFIVSFIMMFSSLVSFVDLFRSFGVVFGCFIIYMFINLLDKYSK